MQDISLLWRIIAVKGDDYKWQNVYAVISQALIISIMMVVKYAKTA